MASFRTKRCRVGVLPVEVHVTAVLRSPPLLVPVHLELGCIELGKPILRLYVPRPLAPPRSKADEYLGSRADQESREGRP